MRSYPRSGAMGHQPGGGAAGVGEDDGQRPAHLTDKDAPAARRYLLGAFPLRRLREEKLADGGFFGYLDGALPDVAALLEKLSQERTS